MRVEELLVGELRDGARVAARFAGVGRVGEQRAVDRVVEDAHRIGERAFHLVENHAVVAQGARRERRALGDVELVVPALLLENRPLGIDGGVEHRVHVDVHEVEQVLLVGGRDGIDGFVGISHGVQERLHGALDEVHERLLHREFCRAAQHRVLEDVKDARVVGGRRFERDGERLVLVFACEIEQSGAGGAVVQHVGVGIELGQSLFAGDGEAGDSRSERQGGRGALARGGGLVHGGSFMEVDCCAQYTHSARAHVFRSLAVSLSGESDSMGDVHDRGAVGISRERA